MVKEFVVFVFFFNDTATTEIYTLSLHDALPIFTCDGSLARIPSTGGWARARRIAAEALAGKVFAPVGDRKSTRLNSSHANISYAVFCLKKKKLHYCLVLLFLFCTFPIFFSLYAL